MTVFNPIVCKQRFFIPLAARITLILMLIVLLRPPSCALGLGFELEDDHLSIHAVNVPLQDVLKQFTGYGIAVRIDPDINPQVTAIFENRDLEDGLKAILKPHNHVFFWKRIARDQDGQPVEAFALNEIHVFRPGLKGRMISFDAAAPDPIRSAQAASPAKTKVKIDANRVIVPVTLGYQNRTVDTTLIFDTGAGSIVLHDNIAVELGIQDTQVSRGIGVGGIEIEARTTRLQFVQVGPHKKDNLRTDIIAYQGTPDSEYNGLLGMNFIRGLKYTIDFNNQFILWNR